jgi:hypothetical protein
MRQTINGKEYSLRDIYRVRWPATAEQKKKFGISHWYGVANTCCIDTKEEQVILEGWAKRQIFVEDAIFPKGAWKSFDIDKIEVLTYDDKDSADENAFHNTVAEFFQVQDDEAASKGAIVGQMFSMGVADGSATYVVTAEKKTTLTIAWMGANNMDRYTDRMFGWGGTFRRKDILPMLRSQKALRAMFAGR